MTERELLEMHSAALGMIWATHTEDLDSALAILDRLESESAALDQEAADQRHLARRMLESTGAEPSSSWAPTKTAGFTPMSASPHQPVQPRPLTRRRQGSLPN